MVVARFARVLVQRQQAEASPALQRSLISSSGSSKSKSDVFNVLPLSSFLLVQGTTSTPRK